MTRWRNKGAPIPHDGGFIERGAEFEAEEDARVVQMWRGKLEALPDIAGDEGEDNIEEADHE